SEFVMFMNFSDGRVSESTRMFQVASPASNFPARRPMRGSGLGAAVDVLPIWRAPLLVDVVVVACAHDTTDSSPTASESFERCGTGDRTPCPGRRRAASSARR